MRFAVLAVSVFVGVLLLVALDWWVDPLADGYRGNVVASALAHDPSCDVSTAILGDRTWPSFKLDLFQRRAAETIVTGTSRVWKIGAHPGERFVNMQLPGMSVDSVLTLFQRLRELAPRRRLTIYVGAEPFWFSELAPSSSYEPTSLLGKLRLLGAAQTLDAMLREVTRRPWEVVDPPSRRPPELIAHTRGCLLDENDAVRRGVANAWAMDGTFDYAYELDGLPAPHKDFLTAYLPRMRAAGLRPELVAQLRAALAFARSAGWRLVGFTPPFAHRTLERIEADAGAGPLIRAYRREIPGLFEAYGFPYVNSIDARSVPCGDGEFTEHDGAHADAACAARLRQRLDAAARG